MSHDFKPTNPRIVCNDGTSLSVQASQYAYCTPRDDHGPYSEVELGFLSIAPGPDLLAYAEDATQPKNTVYGYVPIDLVKRFIEHHGGIKSGKLP